MKTVCRIRIRTMRPRFLSFVRKNLRTGPPKFDISPVLSFTIYDWPTNLQLVGSFSDEWGGSSIRHTPSIVLRQSPKLEKFS